MSDEHSGQNPKGGGLGLALAGTLALTLVLLAAVFLMVTHQEWLPGAAHQSLPPSPGQSVPAQGAGDGQSSEGRPEGRREGRGEGRPGGWGVKDTHQKDAHQKDTYQSQTARSRGGEGGSAAPRAGTPRQQAKGASKSPRGTAIGPATYSQNVTAVTQKSRTAPASSRRHDTPGALASGPVTDSASGPVTDSTSGPATDSASGPATDSASGSATDSAAEPPPVDKDAYFARAFGNRAKRGHQPVHGILVQDGRTRGQILLQLDETGNNVRIDGDGILKLLRPRLDDPTTELLIAKVDATRGRLGLADLRDIGLVSRFDTATLSLHVDVPALLRKKGTHRLIDGYGPKDLDDALAPSKVSGFLNVRAGMGFVEWDQNDSPRREPVRGAAEAAINVMGWVLESEARYAEDDAAPVALQGIRLIKDLPDQMLRFTLGDLLPVYRGHLQGGSMGGFSVVRNFSLQPYRTTHPISRYEFLLQRPSLVHVWIGERLAQTLRLDAGPHDLRDLPLTSGLTDVRLQVIDDVGHEEILTFDAISYQELLQPGLQQFAYSIGFPSIEDGAIRDYAWTQPMLMAFHRVGVLDTLTLGAYIHANLEGAVVGAEGLWATPAGLWGLDAAAGSVTGIAQNYAVSLRYRNMPTPKTLRRGQVWSGSVEAVGSRFSQPGDDFNRPYRMGISGDYGQTLFWKIHGSIGARYRLSGTEPRHSYNVDLSLRRQLWKGTHLSIVGSQRGDSLGESNQRVTFNFLWHLPGRHMIADSFDSESLTNRLSWNYGSPGNVQKWQAWVDSTQGPDGGDVKTEVAYTGHRGEARFSQGVEFPDTRLRGDLRLGSALVFAGNVFGVSRPVSDSFALVARSSKLLRGRTILVNAVDDVAEARTDFMGPGVLGSMSPYSVKRLRLDVPGLPFGYDIGPMQYALLPTYRSGFALRIDVKTTVFVVGTLLDAAGEPVRLRAGEVLALDDPGAKLSAMFTNRSGRFALDRMNPGRYAIRLDGDEPVEIHFEVPPDAVGRHDAGILVLPPTRAGTRLRHNARLLLQP